MADSENNPVRPLRPNPVFGSASIEGVLEREVKRRENEREELRSVLIAEINAADEYVLRDLLRGYLARQIDKRLK